MFRISSLPLLFLVLFSYPGNAQNVIFGLSTENAFNDLVFPIDCNADSSGASIVTGYCMSTPDFDPGTGVAQPFPGSANKPFLVRYKQNGDFDWLYLFPSPGNSINQGTTVITDRKGNIYFGGQVYCTDTVDLDPGAGYYPVIPPPSSLPNMFIVSFDSSGNFRWGHLWGGVQSSSACNSLALDSIGNIYAAGPFSGNGTPFDFDPGTGQVNRLTNSNKNMYILKLDSLGNFVKVVTPNSINSGTAQINEIRLDDQLNWYLCGFVHGSNIDFDPSPSGIYNISTSQNGFCREPFVAKYDSSGALKWVFTIRIITNITTTQVDLKDLDISDDGSKIVITGFISDYAQYDFDPGNATTAIGSTSQDCTSYIACYDSSSALNWAYGFAPITSTPGQMNNWEISFDPAGYINWTGTASGGVYDLNGGSGTAIMNIGTNYMGSGYLVTYDTAGNFIQGFSVNYCPLYSISCDKNGERLVAGNFNTSLSPVNVDPGTQPYFVNTNLNLQCMSLVRYNPAQLQISGIEEPISSSGEISTYPVPASESVTVFAGKSELWQLSLFDLYGNIVITEKFNGDNASINVNRLPSGVYIICIEAEKEIRYGRLIKQ